MKRTIIRNITPLIVLLGVVLNGCVTSDEPKVDDSTIADYSEMDPTNFTASEINIRLTDDAGTALSGLKVSLWNASPLENGEIIFKGITDSNGQVSSAYNFPNHLESVIMEIGYLGMPDYLVIPVEDLSNVNITGFSSGYSALEDNLIPNQSVSGASESTMANGRVAATTIQTLGTYNSQGTPNYLLQRDVISSELLSFVNASLPESKPVPVYHPAYLEDNTKTDLEVLATADVWMTFVSEGAGYKNSLGFYTYDTNNPPASAADIDVLYIGFPNASLSGAGGELRPGDKIYLGQFAAGKTIGFVLIADGFNTSTRTVKTNATRYYSDSRLNPETDESVRQHTVTLYDDVNELFLIGFEDLLRTGNSDNDFNDAVFYITANPIEAINRTNVKPIDKPVDTDRDGVNDTYDEYPNDARYAYKHSYPGENSYGTFAFEDQWPKFGDYDFNDLVVDYQYTQLSNATNKTVKLEAEYVLKAAGAGFHNGFGVQLDLTPNQIASVTGNDIHNGLFTFNSNGTEAGQSKAVIIATDDVHESFGHNGLINTSNDVDYLTPDTIHVDLNFSSALSTSVISAAPFNPFLVINQTRGREVHMPGYEPTDKVNQDYYGTENDATDPSKDSYYRSQAGLPWAMNLPVSFDYPLEKVDIRDAYVHFNTWAKSSGFSYMDWYVNQAGYRNTEKIYVKK